MESATQYINCTACGNTLATDKKMFKNYMMQSLKYWAEEYHVDGFRFDLMGAHDYQIMNEIRSMFDKMYYKRLKAYKQIGYDVYAGEETHKQEANAIFDIDNYMEVYKQDLLEANKEIIISSPAISGKKVDEMIRLLKEKQEAGLRIVIVTWKPDMYGFGDSEYWMELQERMRRNGFEMNLVEDYCQHYCIVDQEIVWYGSMNFLGKEDIEDNLMRVKSKEIANELLELTFK